MTKCWKLEVGSMKSEVGSWKSEVWCLEFRIWKLECSMQRAVGGHCTNFQKYIMNLILELGLVSEVGSPEFGNLEFGSW